MARALRVRRSALALGTALALAGGGGALLGAAVSAGAAPPRAATGTPSTAARPASSTAPSAAALLPAQLRLVSSPVVSGLRQPTSLAGPDDGSLRLYVTEQAGLIKLLTYRGARTYLDLRARTSASGERGLLALAFHPSFRTRPYLYAVYTRKADGAVVLSRFRATRWDAPTVSAATEVPLLAVPHGSYANHNGGGLAFSRSGYLYWGIGDGGGGGDPLNSGQNLRTLLGKVLRLDVNRSCSPLRYCIPATNPYAASRTARREIWLAGLRNPWRLSVDRGDGSLWVGDVGQARYEEVDRIAAERGGYNLGWSCREGLAVYSSARCRTGATYTNPIFVYGHGAECSITGGYVYRGSRYPQGRGSYLATDFCSGKSWAVAPSAGRWVSSVVGTIPGNPVSFGESGAGELYSIGTDGTLRYLRLVPR